MTFAATQEEYDRYVEWAFSGFPNFLNVAWDYLYEQDPLSWGKPTRWQSWASNFLETGGPRIALGAHRGFSKTSFGGAYIPYRLKKNKNLRVRVVSNNDDFAADITNFSKRLVDGVEVLEDLRPGKDQRSSSRKFDVAGSAAALGASVSCSGIFSATQGRRPDLLWIDDIEGANTIDTATNRARLHKRRIDLESLCSRNSQVVVVFTYWSEESEYLHLEQEGYKVVLIPQRYPNAELLDKQRHKLCPLILEDIEKDPSLMTGGGLDGTLGKPICPELFPEEVCQQKELRIGRTQYRLHYLLDTSPYGDEAYPLKCRDLYVMDVHAEKAPSTLALRREPKFQWSAEEVPHVGFKGDFYYFPAETGEMRPYKTVTGAVDPSGRGASGDETGIAIAGILNSHYHFMEIDGYPGGYEEEKFDNILWTFAQYDTRTILVEENGLGSAWGELLRGRLPRIREEAMKRWPLLHKEPWRVSIVPIQSRGRKELRLVQTLEPVANQHRIIINKTIIQREYANRDRGGRENSLRFLWAYQWTRLTKVINCLKNDDRLDPMEFIVRFHEPELANAVNAQIEKQRMEDQHRAANEWLAAKRARQNKSEPKEELVHWLTPLRPNKY